MSDNIYAKVAQKYERSPALVMLFIASLAMLLIGMWLFVEDTVSSKLGLEQIQSAYNMNVQIFSLTYWIMSLAPQVASIVFAYLFFSSGEKKWGAFALIAQLADFLADQWYRSNGNMFNDPAVFAISGLLTFFYFSIGSELFVTVGFGLVIWLGRPALNSWRMALGKPAFKSNNNNQPKQPNESNFKPHPQPAPKSTYQAKHKPTYGPVSGGEDVPDWMKGQ